MTRRLAILAALASLILSTPAAAQRAPFAIPDPDPEVERKSFILADGFEVNLYAADPLIAKPIQMNFDARGRLWVSSSEVYPQITPGRAADDKILILEDKDGDGRAESTTVFAGGLLIPTGVEPGDGGAYVANSTELLFLKDTDGDGVADARRVLLSGFGTEDTHHILHTLRWGMDGMLYMNQSIYIHSHVETPRGVRRLLGGGIWQFRPETMELNVFMRGLVNGWGHHFDRWGQSFATDGASSEGINYVLPGASYFTAVGDTKILPGLNPGSPKHCGLEVMSGRHLPEAYRGDLLTNDFRGNRVCRFALSDDGAGYAARELPELMKTTHVAFRPIDVKMGPDGAIYVADWYNPIIQHGEVDFRDPRRDHTRGRIWRITAKGRPLVDRPVLADATPEVLVESLKAPEDWTRHHARRQLKERGAAASVPALKAWLGKLDAADGERDRLEALWTYQSLDVPEPDLLRTLLEAKEPRIRAAAVRVAQHWAARIPDALNLLAGRVADDNPRVRLEAVRALAHVDDDRAGFAALNALYAPMDRFLDYAVYLTSRETAPKWLPGVVANGPGKANPAHVAFALEAVGSAEAVKPLVAMLAAGTVPAGREESVFKLIATRGGPAELAAMFDLAVDDGPTTAARRVVLLDGLNQATRQKLGTPGGDLGRLARWLDGDDVALRMAAARSAGLWKVAAARGRLLALAGAADTPGLVRSSAMDALARFGDAEARDALNRLAAGDAPLETRAAASAALAAVDPKAGAARAVAVLAADSDASVSPGLIAAFLARREGPAALAAALAGARVPPDVAKLGIRLARGTGGKDPALADALAAAGSLSAAAAPPTGADFDRLVADVARLGDPARGELVFRRDELNCLRCHAVAGSGGRVGPGLESLGASAPVDYIVESLLRPDTAVKENYHSTVVATADGLVRTGIKVRQSTAELVLRDAEDREVAIPLASIEDQHPGGSLMPAGLTESLTRGEFLDLVRFLSSLGKLGPYSVGQARVARTWEVLEPTPEAMTIIRRDRLDAVVAAPEGTPGLRWRPAYSLVSGVLPLDALPVLSTKFQMSGHDYGGRFALARARIEVTTPGLVELGLGDLDGLTFWGDGRPMLPREAMRMELPAGPHTFTFAIDLAKRQGPLRVELRDVSGSPAQARVVVGK